MVPPRLFTTLRSTPPRCARAGKRIFLEKMDGLAEQLKTFTFRMKLSEDKLGRSILDGLNQQMMNAGTNMDAMYEGLARQTDMMRAAIAVEETIADPEELRAFRAKIAAQMSPVTNLNMSPDILEDPDVMQGLMDPKVGVASGRRRKEGCCSGMAADTSRAAGLTPPARPRAPAGDGCAGGRGGGPSPPEQLHRPPLPLQVPLKGAQDRQRLGGGRRARGRRARRARASLALCQAVCGCVAEAVLLRVTEAAAHHQALHWCGWPPHAAPPSLHFQRRGRWTERLGRPSQRGTDSQLRF